MAKIVKCHPDSKLYAKGLCKKCYKAAHKKLPKSIEYSRAYNKEYHYKTYTPRLKCKKPKSTKIYKMSPESMEKIRTSMHNYRKANKGKINSYTAKYRCSKLLRTPKWADLKAIKAFYMNCPKNHHVDHIIPLQGETVSGFHVIENLQYLTVSENCKKHNKLIL